MDTLRAFGKRELEVFAVRFSSALALALGVLSALAPAAPAAAQEPLRSWADRGDYPGMRAALDRMRDTLGLRRAATTVPRPGQAAEARDWLMRGFAGLRLFDLTGQAGDARLARTAFETAASMDPADAWAHFGLGLSWAHGPERRRPAPKIVTLVAFAEAVGRDPVSRARRSLRRALQLDPGLVGAGMLLAELALEDLDMGALEQARATLEFAVASGGASWEVLASLSAVQGALGEAERALSSAELAFEAAPLAASAPASYGLARANFGRALDEAGGRAWFEAVEAADADLARRLFEDVEPITDEWERERWQAAGPEARRRWLREFWDVRAALGGVSVATRIGDHYRRLEIARRRYPRLRKFGAPPTNALLLERPDLPFDDRGIIFIRHGEPVRVIRTPGESATGESWAYALPEGGFRLLHFISYGGSVRMAFAAGDPAAAAADGGFGDAYNEFVLVYNLPCDARWAGERAAWDRRLAGLRCNEYDRRAISAEVRRDARAALGSDSDRPDFTRDLDFVSDVFAFRGPAGLTDVTTALVVPTPGLRPIPVGDGFTWDLQVSVILADTLAGRVTRTDTTLRVPAGSTPGPARQVRVTLTRPVVPGAAQAMRTLVREAADPAHGRMQGRSVDVPDFSPHALAISDIVLASPDSGGTFRRGPVALGLVPTRQFPGGAFLAYYEVYDLTPDAGFTTELIVEKAGGGIGRFISRILGGGPLVRLRFDGSASPTGGLNPELRRVDTSLGPGDYRIRVRVTDHAAGRTTEREREFTVVR